MATDGQNDLPADNDNRTPPSPPDPPATQEVHHEQVSRGEFDSLKAAIDGLTETVARLAPKEPHEDQAPGGVPWTHRGRRL